MSYFLIAVGGTGAKLVQTMIHLSAAGMLPDSTRELICMLVDPDTANGNVTEVMEIYEHYKFCNGLHRGSTDFFKNTMAIRKPWTPVVDNRATLGDFFGYTQLRENNPAEADLMDLLFAPEERDLAIHEGFRGRPSIGSTIFSKSVDFTQKPWSSLCDEVRRDANNRESVPVLLTGSVFGGTGAAGVPTLCRLLKGELPGEKVRHGLILFLPYFEFEPVDGGGMQADPKAFATATHESLKYYDEGQFLALCDSIYAVGDESKAKMTVSAVGAAEQRNEPHFIELIGGLGAVRFMSGEDIRGEQHTLSLAARETSASDPEANTVRWQDLPMPTGQAKLQTARLRSMILFAVAFRHLFYPNIKSDLLSRRPGHHFVRTHVVDEGLDAQKALADLEIVSKYVDSFLIWLLRISKPFGVKFTPGLVNVNVFAKETSTGWELKKAEPEGRDTEFRDRDIERLFLNADGMERPNLTRIWNRADQLVKDPEANGTGRLIRAIYEACKLD